MVQFKNVFTGLEKRPYSRASTAQKCVRAGGKHNDLDNVGYTARHHHLLRDARQFLLRRLFQGARHRACLEPDHQGVRADARTSCWSPSITPMTRRPASGRRSPAFPTTASSASRPRTISGRWATPARADRARRSSIDHGEHIWGGPPGSPEEDGDRFLEFWNLVFMQYEQVTKDERIDLPRPSIDTGMGLERIAAILQGVDKRLRHRSVPASDRCRLVRRLGVTVPTGETVAILPRHRRSSALVLAS